MSRIPNTLIPTNRNALRHGLRSGQLPRGCGYVARLTQEFRGSLEDAVAARNGGQVSIYHAALINSAVRWERHALLCQRWLRLEAEKLNADQRLSYSREVARGSAERDKCLKLLRLDLSEFDAQVASLYSGPFPDDDPLDAPADERSLADTTPETCPAADVSEGQCGDGQETEHDDSDSQPSIEGI